MEIKELFLNELSNSHPFVSKNWAEFKSINGWKPLALLVTNKDFEYEILILSRTFFKVFTLSYMPFSPFPINNSPLSYMIENLDILSKKIKIFLPNSFLLRIDLPFDYYNSTYHKIDNKKFIISKENIQPENTVIVNIKKDYEENFKLYRKRAKRKLKENKNIEIAEWNNDLNVLKKWFIIYEETARKDNFTPRPYKYIKTLLENNDTKLFLAYFNGKIEGGIIVTFSKEIAIYLIGGSNKEINKSVSYSLQDYVIKKCCRDNIKYYDLYGIGNEEEDSHLKSLSLFKLAFGGKILKREKTIDYPLKRIIYNIFIILDKIRFYFYRK